MKDAGKDENKQIIDGFIAHEVSEAVPESVTGEKDEVARVNGVTRINANEEMSGVARQLSVLEFWRPSSDSIDMIENKLSLLK